MALIGELVEELMGDKFKSHYGMDEYKGNDITIGVGNEKVQGNMSRLTGLCLF